MHLAVEPPGLHICTIETGGKVHNCQWVTLSKAQIRYDHHDIGHESSSQRKQQDQELSRQEASLLLPMGLSYCYKPYDWRRSHLPFSVETFHCSHRELTSINMVIHNYVILLPKYWRPKVTDKYNLSVYFLQRC